jgi:lysophospholipase L1-like esterase
MVNIRISFIGDSLIAGTGDPEFLGWPGRIAISAAQRGHDVTVYNLGIRANTSADILKRWRGEAEARAAQGQDNRLIFQFGVNDTKDVNGKRIVEPDQAIAQAREILAPAIAWLPTLMVGPPPIDDPVRNTRIADLSRRLETLCAELNIPYFKSFARLSTTDAWISAQRAGDGVHPVAMGYEAWARMIERWEPWREWAP